MIRGLLRRITDPARSRRFNSTLDAGVGYLNGGRLDKALVCFDELISIAPADAQLYRLKGSLYTVAHDYKSALLNYDKAVELGDEVFDATYGDVEAYIARGHTFTKEGEYRRAAKDFEKALDLDSNYVNAHCRAAYELGVTWDDEPLHPYDIIRTIRQDAIMNQVSKLIDARRLQQGLPNGLPSSALGMAAYRITAKFYDKSINGPDQIRNEFGQFLEREGVRRLDYDLIL